jgi:2-keto-3-deoxy-L-rhamnonate aldolase RhmA
MLSAVISAPSPELLEVAAHAGFDFGIIDAEHGPITISDIAHMARAADAAGFPILVRGPDASRDFVVRSLDLGVAGFVAPEIESGEAAAAVVAATHYPPAGHRGASGHARAYGYSRSYGRQALQDADEAVVTGVHIETPRGVENAEAIFATPGINLVLLGLSDLKSKLAGDPRADAKAEEAYALIGRLSARARVAASTGIQGRDDAARAAAAGFSVLVTSLLPLFFRAASRHVDESRFALSGSLVPGG